MRRTRRWIHTVGLILALGPLAVPATALTVEQVIDKHVQAKGGRAAWDAIHSLRITGTATGFSETHPLTLVRARPGRYHMDYYFGNKRVVESGDAASAWQDSGWADQGPQPAGGADLAVQRVRADFATPLFDWKDRGYEVKLLDRADVDGVPALGIEVKRAEGQREVWYLDPKTYLEMACDSPGSDFGRAVAQRTWFEDFRRVSGVMIPHHIESQWYTRELRLQFDKVEVNVEIDEAMFRLPPPTGMAPLMPLIGTWDVKTEQRNDPEEPWKSSDRRSTVESLLRNALLQERFTTQGGADVLRTLSYDRFRKKYRLTEIETQTTAMNIEEGDFDEQGRLVLSNLNTGTPTEMYGMKFHERLSVVEITPDGFRIEVEVSTDGGANWFLAAKATYKKAA